MLLKYFSKTIVFQGRKLVGRMALGGGGIPLHATGRRSGDFSRVIRFSYVKMPERVKVNGKLRKVTFKQLQFLLKEKRGGFQFIGKNRLFLEET